MLTHQRVSHLSAATVLIERLSIGITIAALLLTWSTGPSTAGNSATAIVEFGVEEISSMDVSGILAHPIRMTTPVSGTVEAGSNGDTYIRYTSVVPHGKTRTISAAISSGTIPRGCRLKLNVVEMNGNGAYGRAVPGGIYLTGNPQGIVTGIGNCFTGTGADDGVRIECALEVEDESKLIADETSTVAVLFTLN